MITAKEFLLSFVGKKMHIRKATQGDLPQIAQFIKELAIYEKMEDECKTTPELLEKSMFPANGTPLVFVLIAETETNQPMGFALYFYNFSTFTGKPGLYLEDIFVRPEFRGKGLGKVFFKELKRISREQGCSRMEWVVLDWNEPSRGFYKSLGAEEKTEWVICRLSGDTLY